MSACRSNDDAVEDEGPDLGLTGDRSAYDGDWADRNYGGDWADRRYGARDDGELDLVGYTWTPFEDSRFRRDDDRFARSDDGGDGNRYEDRFGAAERYPDPFARDDRQDPYADQRFADRYEPPAYDPPALSGLDYAASFGNEQLQSYWDERYAPRHDLYAARDDRPAPYEESPYASASDTALPPPRDDPPAPPGIAPPDIDTRYHDSYGSSPYSAPPPLPDPPLRLGPADGPAQSSLASKLLGAFARKLSGD
jgi:hypothetical protein